MATTTTTTSNGRTSAHTPTEEQAINDNFSFSEHSIDFDVYVKSQMGAEHDSNCDNFYMNGIFMKSFNFTDIKKSLKTSGDCAVFAAGTGINSDRASKLALRFLDEKRPEITASKSIGKAKKKLVEALKHCNTGLIKEGEADHEVYEVTLAVAVYMMDTVIYATCGGCNIIKTNGRKVTSLSTSCSTLGLKNEIEIKTGTVKFKDSDSFILLSKGAASADSPENIGYQVMNITDTKDIVNEVISRISLITRSDLTCMALKAEPYKGIHAKTLIIAGVCFIISILNLVYTFFVK